MTASAPPGPETVPPSGPIPASAAPSFASGEESPASLASDAEEPPDPTAPPEPDVPLEPSGDASRAPIPALPDGELDSSSPQPTKSATASPSALIAFESELVFE